ncbi:hypothetical protein J8F10_08505 [Gemmata sp. G18]|uniref:Uncharacterized protein n=1 Tax=Gemmata palustris TaxID=2822762 RepID=A0ABS5BNS4_9BACT|nr:hypothetical protein [Gemmata palustris]MBP3955320.1 hypothetical protein [Gemmata palustris]
MNARATENDRCLGRVVPDGSNEIGAVPALLNALTGALVTIDVTSCQKVTSNRSGSGAGTAW